MHDYLIVGAGSAGCALANRLTEDGARSVLLLEAGGPDDDPAIQNPDVYHSLFRSGLDWGYETEEEPFLDHRKDFLSQGKVLGGSSSINGMLTCKMESDVLAVVDDRLRVRGVEGLRVIDASIMPTIVNANTNATVIMIAEKGADLLRSCESRRPIYSRA